MHLSNRDKVLVEEDLETKLSLSKPQMDALMANMPFDKYLCFSAKCYLYLIFGVYDIVGRILSSCFFQIFIFENFLNQIYLC